MRAVSAQVRKLCQAAASVRAANSSNRKKAVKLMKGTPVPLSFLITKGPRQWSNALVKSILEVNYTFFFCKNKVYKNVEPQICQNLKNILDAEIVNI